MRLSPELRSKRAEIAVRTSWANTVDRTARTAPAHRSSPVSVDYWLTRLDPKFADATDEQRLAAAEQARSAYMAKLAFKSAKARRRGGAAA